MKRLANTSAATFQAIGPTSNVQIFSEMFSSVRGCTFLRMEKKNFAGLIGKFYRELATQIQDPSAWRDT
jgi:hypothetical protein